MSDETPRQDTHQTVETPRDHNGNPDWRALTGDPFERARTIGHIDAPPPLDDEGQEAFEATDLPPERETGTGGAGTVGERPLTGADNPPDPSDAPVHGVFYTQRGLESIEGASLRAFPDMASERGPDGMPRSMVDQLVVPLHEPIRVLQPDGEEQTLDPASTPFAVRDVRGRIHALTADEHAALIEHGQRLDADQGARGGGYNASLLAGGVAALINAMSGDQAKAEQANARRALEAANAAAAERRRYEPWWSSRAQADVSVANEHIAKAVELGRKIRNHPDVFETVNELRRAEKQTVHEPNNLDAWMDYRKASRDVARHIANNPDLSEDLRLMRGHLDETESAVSRALEAADDAKGQDYAMRDALQGLDTKGLETATEHLRTHTFDGRSDSGEDTEEQVERMRELMKSIQASFSNLVNRIMRLGKGQDSGPEPVA